jgi:hypothetical protein
VIIPDVGDVRDCDVTVTQVSFVGLWVGLLRFACLSLAGISHMKMRATLKLNNSGAVAGKTMSLSQRSNPLTLVSLLDAPDHKNVPVACSLEGAIAIGTNVEIVLAEEGKNGS